VGLVRKAGELRAALAGGGGVFLVIPGDAIEGFVVVAVDEDRGVRLRAPTGGEIVLAPED
jgi:hypothetical protein